MPDALTEIKRFDAAVASNATPSVLPFAGNITTFEPAGDGSSYGLLRQSDCSLSLLNANRNAVLSTTAKYEDTLHQQAQLTSTPDKYTGGCTDPILGRIAHFATIVGITSQGYYIGADGQLNGTESSITTYVYDPVSMKLISSASNPTGENSGNISVGDLNGDGINDIVVPYDPAAYQNGAVSVLLGNADGTFQPAVSLPVPVSVYSVVLDDFNGEGIVNMVVTRTVGSTNVANVVFFPGKGDGTFGSPTTSTVTTAGTLVSADFNGDGKKDLIAGGYFLAGNGKGAFTQGAAIAPSNEDDYYLVPGDFNHDGKMDLAVNDGGQNVVLIYLGNGDGTFTQKATCRWVIRSRFVARPGQ